MTPFHLMVNLTGLSQREAGDFLEIAPASVDKMARGKIKTPDGIMTELHGLHDRQRNAAAQAIAMIRERGEAQVELGLAADDYEAQSPPLGWPCVGAQAGMMALIIAGCPDVKFRIVPRGSTLSSAAAADEHDEV